MSSKNVFASLNYPLTVLAVVAAAVAVYGYFQPDSSQAGRRFYMDKSGGAVLFAHADHQKYGTPCVGCHHELILGQAYDCSECHDDPEYVHGAFAHDELLEIEDHTCIDCHLVQQDSESRNCRTCHPAIVAETEAAEDLGDCQQCHDDPDYTIAEFSHFELLEIPDHACLDCHQISPVAKIYHDSCTECHRAEAAERFIDDQDQAVCKACHLI